MAEIVVVNTDTAPSPRDMEIYRRCEVLGEYQIALAKEFELSQGRISQIVKEVEPWVLGQFVSDSWREKRRQTMRLEFMYAEAIQAWLGSKGEEVTTVEEDDSDDDDTETEGGRKGRVTKTTRRPTQGDPRYLATALKALIELDRLWGADAAVMPNSQPSEKETPTSLDLEYERGRLLDWLEALYGPRWLPELIAAGMLHKAELDRLMKLVEVQPQ